MADEHHFAIVGGTGAPTPRDVPDKASPAVDAQQPAAEALADGADLDDTLIQSKTKKLTKKRYDKELEAFRPEWKTIEHEIEARRLKVVLLVEGRDVARDRGIVTRIAEFADPRVCRVAHVDAAGTRERSQWFFQPYVSHLPAAGEMTVFDGAWYARAALGRATGLLSADEYADVLRASADFERVLVRSGITVLKFWLTVEGDGQEFPEQIEAMRKRWKVVAHEAAEPGDWESIRDQIFTLSDSEEVPWRIVTGPERREVRLRFLGAFSSVIGVEPAPAEQPAVAPPEPAAVNEDDKEPRE